MKPPTWINKTYVIYLVSSPKTIPPIIILLFKTLKRLFKDTEISRRNNRKWKRWGALSETLVERKAVASFCNSKITLSLKSAFDAHAERFSSHSTHLSTPNTQRHHSGLINTRAAGLVSSETPLTFWTSWHFDISAVYSSPPLSKSIMFQVLGWLQGLNIDGRLPWKGTHSRGRRSDLCVVIHLQTYEV